MILYKAIKRKKGIDMEATDLMIGDWVCLKDDTKSELPLKVDGVLTDDISLEGEGFLGGVDGLIRPIPLTPEILWKNGFNFIRNSDTTSVGNREWIYEGLEISTSSLYRGGSGPYYISIYDSVITCEYVHQLQHSLRLSKLDELADNFKI